MALTANLQSVALTLLAENLPVEGRELREVFTRNLVVSTGLKLEAGGQDCSYKISSDF